MTHRAALTCVLLPLSLLVALAAGHGFLCEPRPRGTIARVMVGRGKVRSITKMFFPRSAVDYLPHFPAGDKGGSGFGLRSQKKAAYNNWTPYEPTRPGFRFRAGVCGDMKLGYGRQEHLKGGRFYYPPESPYISRYYRQGQILNAKVVLTAHHNGFYQFTICDVKRCPGGEISEKCLRNGNICRKLKRVWEKRCEVGWSKSCAPIDPNYPTRWYLPCSTVYPRQVYEEQWHIKFHLPKDLVCKHCVLQWYWVSANTCNPPGLTEYYRGPRGPHWWGKCKGQGLAVGGYRPPWRICGGKYFPEEYYNCADIAILPRRGMSRVRPKYKYVPKGRNPIQFVQVYVGGVPQRRRLKNGERMWIRDGTKRITLEAIAFKGAKPQFVYFAIQNHKRSVEWRAPYFYLGNTGRRFRRGIFLKKGDWIWVQITSRNGFGRLHFTTIHLHT